MDPYSYNAWLHVRELSLMKKILFFFSDAGFSQLHSPAGARPSGTLVSSPKVPLEGRFQANHLPVHKYRWTAATFFFWLHARGDCPASWS